MVFLVFRLELLVYNFLFLRVKKTIEVKNCLGVFTVESRCPWWFAKLSHSPFQKIRPCLEDIPKDLVPLLQSCWKEDPKSRPEFMEITVSLSNYQNSISTEINANETVEIEHPKSNTITKEDPAGTNSNPQSKNAVVKVKRRRKSSPSFLRCFDYCSAHWPIINGDCFLSYTFLSKADGFSQLKLSFPCRYCTELRLTKKKKILIWKENQLYTVLINVCWLFLSLNLNHKVLNFLPFSFFSFCHKRRYELSCLVTGVAEKGVKKHDEQKQFVTLHIIA